MMHAVADHLWQSTLFAAAAAAIAACSSTSRGRYWIWFAASVKFLVPFALISGLGAALAGFAGLASEPGLPQELLNAIEPVAAPFSAAAAPQAALVEVAPRRDLASGLLLGAWLCGTLAVAGRGLVRLRRIRAAVRGAVPLALACPLPVKSARTLFGPGVVGVFRPTLLLPADIVRQLAPQELAAVLEHELAHVRRRDNLTAAVHSFVAALFWFHPLVWWIGARLLEAREQACDDAVIGAGCDRSAYAQGILKTCKLYAASHATAASATGGDLKRRIAAIMTSCAPRRAGVAERALVTAWLIAASVVPLVAGLGNAQPQRDAAAAPPVFEELHVQRAPGLRQIQFTDSAGTSRVSGLASLRDLIGLTDYADVASEQIVGGPEWLNTYGFEVAIAYKTSTGSRASAMRYVLEQRFKLAVHVETDPVYVLETLPTGPRFLESSRESVAAPRSQEAPGAIVLKGAPASNLAAALSRDLGHPVLDHTGLAARYDFDLRWSVAQPLQPTDPLDEDSAQIEYAAALANALRAQLGLQLRSFPRQMLVVDHAELPAGD